MLPGQIKLNLAGISMDSLVPQKKKKTGRPKSKSRMVCLDTYFPPETIEAMDRYIQTFGISTRSDFIRTAVNRRLQSIPKLETPNE